MSSRPSAPRNIASTCSNTCESGPPEQPTNTRLASRSSEGGSGPPRLLGAIAELEPFFGEFLYTHVDLEGLMRGTDMNAIATLRAATARALTAAGGITTREEIDRLDAMGVDAVVGMALYTGRLELD